MAGTVNKVILVGRIGHDIELRYTGKGTAVATIRVATDDYRGKDEDGNAKTETEWHSVVLWAGLAEFINNYGGKGSLVYIEGSNQTRKWTDPKGNDKYTTEVKAREVHLLGGKSNGGNTKPDGSPGDPVDPDDELPF
jgi:single-strand DNA-binding protein